MTAAIENKVTLNGGKPREEIYEDIEKPSEEEFINKNIAAAEAAAGDTASIEAVIDDIASGGVATVNIAHDVVPVDEVKPKKTDLYNTVTIDMEYDEFCKIIKESLEKLAKNNVQYKCETSMVDNILRVKCGVLVFYCMLLVGTKFLSKENFLKIGITDNPSFLSSQIKYLYEERYTFDQKRSGWNDKKNFYTSQQLAGLSIQNFIVLIDIATTKKKKF